MRRNRTNLFLGLLLVLIGVWLVITRQVPAIQHWLDNNLNGAVWTIAAGVLVLFIGLITGAPGMAVPASIIAGIGGILYYQNATGNYESWSYMWALIPGFVGVGTILAGLLGDNTRNNLGRGLNLIVISAAMFLIFASFFGGLSILGDYGPAAILIALGVYILVRGLLRSGYRGPDETR
jgi:peptidoglycan/LPS O-acetylase OafA/YrhL